MGRCQSTPGLVESCGRTTLEDMYLPQPSLVPPHHATMLQQQRQTQYDQVQILQNQQQQHLQNLAHR